MPFLKMTYDLPASGSSASHHFKLTENLLPETTDHLASELVLAGPSCSCLTFSIRHFVEIEINSSLKAETDHSFLIGPN